MPLSKKRTYQRHSEPKLFQCTGFGDCHMVFTRSEHLARHARKHTGEKPFKCCTCDRAFSRFDNMIQHTATHNRKNNGDRKSMQNNKKHNTSKPSHSKETRSNKNGSNNGSQHLVPLIATPEDMGYSSFSPHAPPQLSLPVSPASDIDSTCYIYQPLPSISDPYFQHSPTVTPTSASMDYFPHINSTPSAISPLHPTFLPSPKELLLHQMPMYPLKHLREYDHGANEGSDAWSSMSSPPPSSPASSSSSPMSPPAVSSILVPPVPSTSIGSGGELSRRLSHVELALPIQELSTYHGAGADGVDVTGDEFEALQAFSQLSSSLSLTRGCPFGTNKSRPASVSFNLGATQVNALRQNLALAHESSSRLSPRSSI